MIATVSLRLLYLIFLRVLGLVLLLRSRPEPAVAVANLEREQDVDPPQRHRAVDMEEVTANIVDACSPHPAAAHALRRHRLVTPGAILRWAILTDPGPPNRPATS